MNKIQIIIDSLDGTYGFLLSLLVCRAMKTFGRRLRQVKAAPSLQEILSRAARAELAALAYIDSKCDGQQADELLRPLTTCHLFANTHHDSLPLYYICSNWFRHLGNEWQNVRGLINVL